MTQPQESLCKHCDQLIRKFQPYPAAASVWMHIDGHHAYPECRSLKATPKDADDGP